MDHFWDTVFSYLVAFGSIFVSNLDNFVWWGGVVLLIVRLIADIPRAYAVIRKVLR